MDKNTIIGFVLIILVIVGFSYFSRPSQEEIARIERYNDSIQHLKNEIEAARRAEAAAAKKAAADTNALFGRAASGESMSLRLHNDVLDIEVDAKGGTLAQAVLKRYNDQQHRPLTLFGGEDAHFNFKFNADGKVYNTANYYFTPVNHTDTTLTMRLMADSTSYIDFDYALRQGSYLVAFSVTTHGMDRYMSPDDRRMNVDWVQDTRQQERSATFENTRTELIYRTMDGDVDNLSRGGSDSEEIKDLVQWIGYKNQFFSTAWICDAGFSSTTLESAQLDESKGYLKRFTTHAGIDLRADDEAAGMLFYIGPNHFNTLKDIDETLGTDYDLQQLVYLGWVLFRWVNRIFTIPLFDWLSGYGLSMGLILLIMTVIVKLVIFPFQYKSFMSSAKLKALRPEIDEINKKYPNQEDAMRRQQETMALYSRYGVSPMGGCLPMLLQMPVLFALFMFVPSAIELRQQSFLWADDLSSYDALISWGVHIPLIGNHISLFCLLMCITTLANTYYMQKQQPMQQEGMAFMKWFMYLMPLMFIFILNDYPSGLNYYYFLSTVFSIAIMFVLDKTLDKAKLRARLEENLKKPRKKSNFMQRLEEMQKEQQRIMDEQKRRQK